MKKPLHILALAILLLSPLSKLLAQDPFQYRAQVDAVDKTAYYDLLLPPTLTCLLEPGFGNLRLRDTTGQDVPFILKNEHAETQSMDIEWMPKVQDHYWAHWYSRCFFANAKQELLDRMVLRIRNADVQQRFWLSGSDDMEDWYIIKEDYAYAANYNPEAGSNLVTIHFPPVDYKYFKVELRHFWREPIQIMGAGIYRFDHKDGHFQEIPGLVPSQSESNQASIVDLPLNGNHYLDRVYIEIDGPELYHREAELQAMTGTLGGKWETVKQFVLSSREEGLISLDDLRATKLRLRIDNKDDKPLRVAGMRAWQTRKYLVANLKEKAPYAILVGDPDLRAASYDLAHFEDKLPKVRDIARVGPPTDLRPKTEPAPSNPAATPASPGSKPEETKPIFEHPAFLWGAIGLVVLIVGFMALKMLREMKEPGGQA